MGEEYGEDAPFVYFISHSDPNLIEAVRRGRKEEFKAFQWKGEPFDPQDRDTFLRSKINWDKRKNGHHKVLLDFYKHLITLRRGTPALSNLDKSTLDVYGFEKDKIFCIRRWARDNEVFCIFNFQESDMNYVFSLPESNWGKIFDSSDSTWNGPGSLLPKKITTGDELTLRGRSFAMYRKELQ
jgi:maltooligosyltrehalose trehalohydrolase